MIQINNLCFSYTNTPPYILDGVNLSLEKGSYLSILGENGSAKSTLVKLILGLLKPNKGSISLGTNQIGYVPQRMESFNAQFPITIKEMLHTHKKVLKIKAKNSIEESLEAVGMASAKNKLIGNLSGGQQQKVFIARALMGHPDLLILDEPSTGVDVQSMKEIYALIKKLSLEKGITVISIEHNLQAAIENSTHIFEMGRGKGTLYAIEAYRTHLQEEAGCPLHSELL